MNIIIIYKRFLIFFFVIFFSFTATLIADDKIYYLNVDFLLNESKIGKKIIKELENLHEDNLKLIKETEKKLIQKDKDIKNTKNIISKIEFEKKIASLNKELNEFNNFRNNLSNNFNSQKIERLNSLFKDINPIIENYMKKNNINILLDKKNIFIGNIDRDITNDIIEIIDQKLN